MAGLNAQFGANALTDAQRRIALADWITAPANPLTRRVIVNRLWHYHFGTGLVDTPSDFGIGGGRPSHPELLDWLAEEFARARVVAEGDAPAHLPERDVSAGVGSQESGIGESGLRQPPALAHELRADSMRNPCATPCSR